MLNSTAVANLRMNLILATLGDGYKRSWQVGKEVGDDNAPMGVRPLTASEINLAAKEVARRVRERTWGWVLK